MEQLDAGKTIQEIIDERLVQRLREEMRDFLEEEERRILYGTGTDIPQGYLSGLPLPPFHPTAVRTWSPRPPRRIARRAHQRKMKRGR